jgi:hypothetical protein
VMRPDPRCALNAHNHSRRNWSREARPLNLPKSPFFKHDGPEVEIAAAGNFPMADDSSMAGEVVVGLALSVGASITKPKDGS